MIYIVNNAFNIIHLTSSQTIWVVSDLKKNPNIKLKGFVVEGGGMKCNYMFCAIDFVTYLPIVSSAT